MSRGRFCMMWTLFADVAGLILSYLYGAVIPVWVGSRLPGPLGFVRTAALRVYDLPFSLFPHAIQVAFLHNTGLTWLVIALMFRLGYLLRYLLGRASSKDLVKPTRGRPESCTGRLWSSNSRSTVKPYSAGNRRFG